MGSAALARTARLATIRAFWSAARAGDQVEAGRLAVIVGFSYCPSQFKAVN